MQVKKLNINLSAS